MGLNTSQKGSQHFFGWSHNMCKMGLNMCRMGLNTLPKKMEVLRPIVGVLRPQKKVLRLVSCVDGSTGHRVVPLRTTPRTQMMRHLATVQTM